MHDAFRWTRPYFGNRRAWHDDPHGGASADEHLGLLRGAPDSDSGRRHRLLYHQRQDGSGNEIAYSSVGIDRPQAESAKTHRHTILALHDADLPFLPRLKPRRWIDAGLFCSRCHPRKP